LVVTPNFVAALYERRLSRRSQTAATFQGIPRNTGLMFDVVVVRLPAPCFDTRGPHQHDANEDRLPDSTGTWPGEKGK